MTRRTITLMVAFSIAITAVVAAATGSTAAADAPQVRGFDGTTIKVAGIGGAANFQDADLGTKARFKRANETGELPGIKLDYTEFADDKQDPAVALSEARRLVTQEQVFAIVPDLSAMNPGAYLNAQHVPYVGWAFDNTYCSRTPTRSLYGFGYSGCQVPEDPPYIGDGFATTYRYVSANSGKKAPTIVLFSGDNASGKNTTRIQASAAQGAGFKVVSAKGSLPEVATDYTPYIQQWLVADNGRQPDVIDCLASLQCLPIWDGLKAAGFKGTFQTPLYTDALLKPLAGTTAASYYNIEPNPGLQQMEADLNAVAPNTKLTTSNAAAYFAADMFIQALKKVGKRNLTPENVQRALSKQTWGIKGLVGPYKYPASTVVGSPSCLGTLVDENGTAWKTVDQYSCSAKTFAIDPKFQS